MDMVSVDYGEILNGASVVMDKVQFIQGKYFLTTEAEEALESLAGFLKSRPGLRIELSGHTDNVGNPDLNYELSESRVKEVKRFLVNRGISEDLISTRAFGGSQPIASNKYLDTRKLNRRVELRIIE